MAPPHMNHSSQIINCKHSNTLHFHHFFIVYFTFVLQIDASRLEFHDWFGTIEGQISWRNYIDTFLMMICGGIPWQPYYQRALAVKTTRNAQILSVFATLGCFLFMIPPILIGVAIKSTENETLAPYNVTENPSLILPVSLVALTPYWISMLGLSAVR